MKVSRNFRQFSIFPVFLFLIYLIIYYWSKTTPLLKPDEWQSWEKFLAFSQDPVIFQTVGSSFMIKYIPFALVFLWIIFLLQTWWNKGIPSYLGTIRVWHQAPKLYIFWSNWPYMIFTTIACIVWIYFVAFVQHYNLYYDATYGCPGLAGYFAHWSSSFCITLILYNVNLMDIFQLKGRKGRIIEVILILVVLLVIAMNFEYVQALFPEIYESGLVDMRADMFMNLSGAGFAAALYQLIVPFEE